MLSYSRRSCHPSFVTGHSTFPLLLTALLHKLLTELFQFRARNFEVIAISTQLYLNFITRLTPLRNALKP